MHNRKDNLQKVQNSVNEQKLYELVIEKLHTKKTMAV